MAKNWVQVVVRDGCPYCNVVKAALAGMPYPDRWHFLVYDGQREQLPGDLTDHLLRVDKRVPTFVVRDPSGLDVLDVKTGAPGGAQTMPFLQALLTAK